MPMLPNAFFKQWVKPFQQQLSSLCLLIGLLVVGWVCLPALEPSVADWAKLTFAKPMITDHSPLPNVEGDEEAKPLSVIALVDDQSIKKLEKKYGSYPWQGKTYQTLLASLEQWYHPSAIALTKPFTPKTRDLLILNASSRLTQTLTPWQIEALADDVFESPLSIGELNKVTLTVPTTLGNSLRSVTLLWEFPHSKLSEKR